METGFIVVLGLSFILVFIALFLKNKNKPLLKNVQEYKDAANRYISSNNINLENMDVYFLVDGHFEISNKDQQMAFKISGTIKKGTINVGDTLNYIDKNCNVKTTKVLAIEQFQKNMDTVSAEQYVGITVDTNEKMSLLFK